MFENLKGFSDISTYLCKGDFNLDQFTRVNEINDIVGCKIAYTFIPVHELFPVT